jgi:branched-chain amino acid transport system ATP-binding protein
MKADFGLTILLVEQNVQASLDAADYVYILHEGRIKAQGSASEIMALTDIREAFLGI